MHGHPRRAGRPAANALHLHSHSEDYSIQAFYPSADGSRVVEVASAEVASSSLNKRRKVVPADIDDTYGSWVPGGDEGATHGDNEEAPQVAPQVLGDPGAAGKRKRYESSVSCSYTYLCSPTDMRASRTSPWSNGGGKLRSFWMSS